jgi:hypothetical protein
MLATLILAAAVSASATADTGAFIITTDFSNGGLDVVDLDDLEVHADLAVVYQDARARWQGGLLYVINRRGRDNIQVIDPADNYSSYDFSVGNGSNPADFLLLSPTKAYVTRYELASILIVNPVTGATLGQISLAPFADGDGIPNMDRMIRVGNRVFVSIQRLAGFTPTDSSMVAVIDPTTDTLIDADPVLPGVQAILLEGTNPVSRFVHDPVSGRLLIGCAGAYGTLDGGFEWIDPTGLRSLGFAATESDLGGDIGGVAWNGAAHSYAIVTDASFNASVVSWSANTGQPLGTLLSTSSYLPDCDVDDRGRLWVCQGNVTAPATYVFSTTNDQLITTLTDHVLAPMQVVFDRQNNVVTAVADPEPSPVFAASWPNPARRDAHVELSLTTSARLRVDVFDAAGRRVRTIADGAFEAGSKRFRWDLRDGAGRRVEPGVYLASAKIDGNPEKTFVRRMIVLY